ncbi:MAG: sigma-54-dependent Fis family transcriptional regulator [Pirellulaceae bacterium]|nr:sigma-54-dependent Fis family transcriptional regulator [Pirellulaceae bacterium]
MNTDLSAEHSQILSDLSRQFLLLAAECEAPNEFLEDALPSLMAAAGGDYIALLRGERGKWRSLACAGLEKTPPVELAAEALDREGGVNDADWAAVPLAQRSSPGEVLAIHLTEPKAGRQTADVSVLVPLVDAALSSIRLRLRQHRRIDRLQTILDIAGRWKQTQRTDELLRQIAEASTQLLSAERASIFLWDKPNRSLVARPALGVDGEELRIADDVGVVGQVVHTGEARRVDMDEAKREIDHRVDEQLGFQTRNLLCVPLRSSANELFGAFELMNKVDGNFTAEDQTALVELATHAGIALENSQQYEQLLKARQQMTDQAAEGVRLIGESPAIEALRSTVGRIADTDLAILIQGENGTGKEVISQLIHYLSGRRQETLVAVNCAALTETLLESELFGHEKGAFTDAHEARPGKFELASGGTLFLDEIGEMSLGGQAKLLRVIEEKVVVRVGGSRPIHTDARVVAATNKNLAQRVREKAFREDLFFRLNVVTLELPPLRERGDDILLLAQHFLSDFCVKARRKLPKFTAAARKRLLAHSWPGNVRELRNLMERLTYLSEGDKIDADELAFILAPNSQSSAIFTLDLPLTDATRRFQVEYISKHVEDARGNMTDAAARLGLQRSNLYRKMRQLEMTTGDE